MKNKALIAISLILVLALGLFLAVNEAQSRRQAAHIAALQAQAKPLEERRLELTRELTRLENSYPLLTRGIATEELLFLDPVPELLDAALPLMEEYGYPGMLVFSEGKFPGDPGALSKDAFAQLQKKGWSWCVLCSGSLEPEEWFPHLDSLLEAHGLKRPEAIYFKDGAFLLKWEEPVRGEGFTAVIHHGEHSLPLISTDLGEDLWYSGALPWNFDGVKTEIQDLSQVCGNLCFEISLHGDAAFNEASFVNMLDYVASFVEEDDLHVVTLDGAREEHQQALDQQEQVLEEYERQRASIAEQIQTLDVQIQEIYSRWKQD